jgi:hypothetical protein
VGRRKSEHELRSLCSQLLTVEGKEAREADEASETLERMERYGQPDSKKATWFVRRRGGCRLQTGKRTFIVSRVTFEDNP